MNVKRYLKEHKKEIIVGVSLAAAGITCYVVFRNREALVEAMKNAEKAKDVIKGVAAVKEEDGTRMDFTIAKEAYKTVDVSSHIRRLPEGQHASKKALTIAFEKAIELGENETVVSAYQKTIKKAA